MLRNHARTPQICSKDIKYRIPSTEKPNVREFLYKCNNRHIRGNDSASHKYRKTQYKEPHSRSTVETGIHSKYKAGCEINSNFLWFSALGCKREFFFFRFPVETRDSATPPPHPAKKKKERNHTRSLAQRISYSEDIGRFRFGGSTAGA
jgi:hypothetical protein